MFKQLHIFSVIHLLLLYTALLLFFFFFQLSHLFSFSHAIVLPISLRYPLTPNAPNLLCHYFDAISLGKVQSLNFFFSDFTLHISSFLLFSFTIKKIGF